MTTMSDTTSANSVRFSPRRLAHVNLFVTELQRSRRFYTEICGLDIVFDEPGIMTVFLSNGSSHHDLALMEVSTEARVGRDGHVQVPQGRGRTSGLNHLGFEMETEARLVEAIQRARMARFNLHRTVDHQISHSAYFFDPDGNYIEMYADATRDWRGVYRNSANQLISGSWDPDAVPPTTEILYEPNPNVTVVADAALHPVRTARATFIVKDLPRSVAFYRDVVGLEPIRMREHERAAVFGGESGEPNLCLVQLEGESTGLHHFGLQIQDLTSLESGIDNLRETGVEVIAEIENATKRSVVVSDPDGNRVEFFVRGTASVDAIDLNGDSDLLFLL